MRTVFAVLSLAASAFAFQVTQPNGSQGWTLNSNSNKVAWTSVSTDRANFTIVLVNQNTTPAFQQVLDALVDTNLSSIFVNLPNTVTAGKNYQVNLVQDADDLNTILAQSPQFTVASASSSTASGASVTAPTVSSPTGNSGSVSQSAPAPDQSTSALNPTSNANGAVGRAVGGGVIALSLAAVSSLLF